MGMSMDIGEGLPLKHGRGRRGAMHFEVLKV